MKSLDNEGNFVIRLFTLGLLGHVESVQDSVGNLEAVAGRRRDLGL